MPWLGMLYDVQAVNQSPEPPNLQNVMPAPAQAKETYLAWFDGTCKPVNPGGTASFGVVIKDKDGIVLLREHGVVGKGDAMSNNVTEYAGVLHILKYLSSRSPGRMTIYGDSNLVINQLNGRWRIRKGLCLAIATETKELLADLRGQGWQISFCWIPREQNEECDALSKKRHWVIDKPCSARGSGHGRQPDARDAPMIDRTIKATGITVLRGDASRVSDRWVCRCPCGRYFCAGSVLPW